MSFPISNPPIHEADGRSWWNGLYGLTVDRGGEFRVAARHMLAGDDTIVWLKHQSTEAVTINLEVD